MVKNMINRRQNFEAAFEIKDGCAILHQPEEERN